jgi:hypothetical protein
MDDPMQHRPRDEWVADLSPGCNVGLVRTAAYYHPGLIDGFLASTGLDLTPLCNPTLKDL